MSRATLAKHYERILKAWPIDLLRPNVNFQKLLQKRLENQKATPSVDTSTTSGTSKQTAFSEGAELRQINALYSLLDNRYSKQYPLSKSMMNPQSNPTFYHQLATELEEVPNLTILQKLGRWVRSRIRFS